MNTDIWFPCYPSNLIADTTRLCPHDFGAYWRLLCDYYMNGPLPNDNEDLRRISGVDPIDWERTKSKVMVFFQLNGDGKFHNKKADGVIRDRNELVRKKKAQTSAARAARSANQNNTVTDNVTDTVTDVQVQVQVQSQVQEQEQLKVPSPTPLGGRGGKDTEKKEWGVDPNFLWLSEELIKMYRPNGGRIQMGEEQNLVAEVARRPEFRLELENLKALREITGKQKFPQSIKSLCREWQSTVDRSESQTPPPKQFHEKSLGEKESDRICRHIKQQL